MDLQTNPEFYEEAYGQRKPGTGGTGRAAIALLALLMAQSAAAAASGLASLALKHAAPAQKVVPTTTLPGFVDTSALINWERGLSLGFTEGAGVAWVDYDDDGDLDLYVINSPGGDSGLLRNDGSQFTDVAALAGVAGGEGYAGVAVADVDNNGWPDLFLTGAGSMVGAGISSRLYLNNGDGSFTDVTANAGIDLTVAAMMPVFGDIDNDGYIDLFLTVPGNRLTGDFAPQKLYRNNGDGTFADIGEAAGVATATGSCVAAFTDVNADNRQDIVVGNCNAAGDPNEEPTPVRWQLWLNQGDNTFKDIADYAGLNDRSGFATGLALGDADVDGDIDMFVAGLTEVPGAGGEPVLFLKQALTSYVDGSYGSGLGQYEWGMGASFADFDNDGDQEVVTTGSLVSEQQVILGDLAGPGRVFDNDGSGHMTAAIEFGLQNQFTSGLAIADYDGDGFTDVVIVKTAFDLETGDGRLSGNGKPLLLRNLGNDNHSVTVRLRGTRSNRMGIGARVWLHTRYGPQMREVYAGSGFASNNSPWPTFGMRDARRGTLIVRWPSGLLERFAVAASPDLLTLVEGSGESL